MEVEKETGFARANIIPSGKHLNIKITWGYLYLQKRIK